MTIDEKYIFKCLDLAKLGLKDAAPNPSVGAILVYNNKIIGEGYTSPYGGAHAEVNCINSVKSENVGLISKSTLYVSLEPCSHYGKTPPCSDLIIEKKLSKVVIGCIDSYSEVSGNGIKKLKQHGVNVVVGVLEQECLHINRRFFTFHNNKRPYITLKWAETQDGFIDIDRSQNKIQDNWITSPESKVLVHQWRSEEQAIMIGTNTALNDNPKLTVREIEGKNPLRVVLDMNLRLPNSLHVFDKSTPSIVFNKTKNETNANLEYIKIENDRILENVLSELHKRNILSVIIEGGAQLLNSFIEQDLWDDAKVFVGNKNFEKGLKAPKLNKPPFQTLHFGSDILSVYKND